MADSRRSLNLSYNYQIGRRRFPINGCIAAMTENAPSEDQESIAVAGRWCDAKGSDWKVLRSLGRGGTAPVFEIDSPDGLRALKIHTPEFSGDQIELDRIQKQLELRGHDCPSLVQVYDGGNFEDRLFVLMSRAEGSELAKCLDSIPREQIRMIVDKVARAAIYLESRGLCHRDIKAANVFVSDDYSRTTLLDVSVIRDIRDPIGVGTDHEGQLPVVATARYSPPEYLFRLLETGPRLWHALTVYQLGALLHDLIMREQMFQAEYEASTQNRYRFAWIVATIDPKIDADDVDEDLLLLARRALDKNWKRRSSLTLEDFLSDSSVERRHALELLGIGLETVPTGANLANRVRRVTQVARDLEETILAYLKGNGVQAKHRVEPCHIDTSKEVILEWKAPALNPNDDTVSVNFRLTLSLVEKSGQPVFEVSANLSRSSPGEQKEESIELPPIADGEDVVLQLTEEAERVLSKLAVQLAAR